MKAIMKALGYSRCQVCGHWVMSAGGLFTHDHVGSICEHCHWEQVSEWELKRPFMKLGQNGNRSYADYKASYEVTKGSK